MSGSSGKALKQSFQDEGITLEQFTEKAKKMELLKFLTSPDLKHIYNNVGLTEYPTDEHIIMRWEKGDSVFILFSGTAAQYLIDDKGSPKYSAKYKHGDMFGEEAYLSKASRKNSVVTTSPSTAIKLKVSYLKVVAGTNRELHDFLTDSATSVDATDNEVTPNASGYPARNIRPDVEGEAKFHLEGTKVSGMEAQFGIVQNLSTDGCRVDMDGDMFLEYEKGLQGRKVPMNIKVEGMEKPVLAVGRVAWYKQAEGFDVCGFRYHFGLNFIKFLGGSGEVLKKFYELKKLELRESKDG